MRRPCLLRAALAVLLLSACASSSAAPASRPGSAATPSVRSAAGIGASPGAAQSVALPCLEAIAPESHPSGDSTVVLGVVALPTGEARTFALQTSLSGENDPTARLFAKQGLEVKAGAAFEIVVPDEVADRFSVGWGNPGRRTRRLVVQGCDEGSAWLAYAGGYWVRHVGCLPLIVRAGGREQRVLIGVGAPCPGQKPPPKPTQT